MFKMENLGVTYIWSIIAQALSSNLSPEKGQVKGILGREEDRSDNRTDN